MANKGTPAAGFRTGEATNYAMRDAVEVARGLGIKPITNSSKLRRRFRASRDV